MNWRQGFFRVWLALSVAWVLCGSIVAYERVTIPNQSAMQRVADRRAQAAEWRSSGNQGFSSYDFDPPPVILSYWPYIGAAAAGPLTLLLVWFGGLWIAAGFKRNGGPSN